MYYLEVILFKKKYDLQITDYLLHFKYLIINCKSVLYYMLNPSWVYLSSL